MKTNKTLKTLLIAAIATSALTACNDPEWQATVYNKEAGTGKVIGVYETRAECEDAGTMHFAEDKEKARKMMAEKAMSFGCAAVKPE